MNEYQAIRLQWVQACQYIVFAWYAFLHGDEVCQKKKNNNKTIEKRNLSNLLFCRFRTIMMTTVIRYQVLRTRKLVWTKWRSIPGNCRLHCHVIKRANLYLWKDCADIFSPTVGVFGIRTIFFNDKFFFGFVTIALSKITNSLACELLLLLWEIKAFGPLSVYQNFFSFWLFFYICCLTAYLFSYISICFHGLFAYISPDWRSIWVTHFAREAMCTLGWAEASFFDIEEEVTRGNALSCHITTLCQQCCRLFTACRSNRFQTSLLMQRKDLT